MDYGSFHCVVQFVYNKICCHTFIDGVVDELVDCGPRNVAVIIDTSMLMPCTRHTSDIYNIGIWRHFPVVGNRAEGVIMYNNDGDMHDEYGNFRVNNSSEGQLDLSTDSIRSTDAGVYQCSITCEKSGLVIVLGEKYVSMIKSISVYMCAVIV